MRLESYDFFRQYQQKKIEKCIFRREVAYVLGKFSRQVAYVLGKFYYIFAYVLGKY